MSSATAQRERALPTAARLRPRALAALPLVPPLAAIAVFVAFGAYEGGYPTTTWYPGALFLIALLVVSLMSVPAAGGPSRPMLAAVALLAAYAAWTYASITWADQRGDAWDGANRTLMYAVVFALFALWPLARGRGLVVLGAFGLGVAALGTVELLRVDAAPDPATYFIDGRLSQPLGYQNANAAFWTLGLWPCALVASRREVAPVLRGLALGSALVLLDLAILAQSRAWLVAFPLAALVALSLTPRRTRLLLTFTAIAAAGGATLEPLLRVYGSDLERGVYGATVAIMTAAAVLAVAGTVAAYLDRRYIPVRRRRRLTSRQVAVVAVTALVLAVGGVAVAARALEAPARLGVAWEQIKRGDTAPVRGDDTSRFSASAGSNRYDFWRVAVERFNEHPVRGIGIDNFQQDYLARGRSTELPRYPHSLELGVLSQTGLVGGLTLGAALVLALLVACRATLRRSSLTGAAAATGITGFAYWLLHGSVDWLWEFPALGGPAFAMLGLAAALGRRPPRGTRERVLVRGRGAFAGVVLAASIPVALLAATWTGERELERAARIWPLAPDAALQAADRAAALEPLASEPFLVGGSIALRAGRPLDARRRFRAALVREPRSAYAALELGAIASERGRRAEALALLERSARLSPRDEITLAALRRVRRGRSIDSGRMNAQIRARALLRTR